MQRKKPTTALVPLPSSTVTQDDLAEISRLQAAAWQAHRLAVQATDQLERRLRHGATVEDGQLAWDSELGMVRSRKVG
jgi:hypothetical protein